VKPKVLVAEDDATIRALLHDVLATEGYDVVCVNDGEEALRVVDAFQPDLILSDVMMPNLDGVSMVARLRQRGSHVPVILMSSYLRRSPLASVQLVTKPFDIASLLAVIASTLDQRKNRTTSHPCHASQPSPVPGTSSLRH
jgi:DNA-binding response OmpR family regulator